MQNKNVPRETIGKSKTKMFHVKQLGNVKQNVPRETIGKRKIKLFHVKQLGVVKQKCST